jgi:hypothetical protein
MPNADTQRALMISSYMADEPVVRTRLALRPQVYAGGILASAIRSWRSSIPTSNYGGRPSKWSLAWIIGPPSVAPRFTGQLTSPLSNCLKRRRPPLLGCVQLSSTSSRGMTATFSKRVARTSRRFCGRPFFKSRGPPRRLAPRKEPSHGPHARPAMDEATRLIILPLPHFSVPRPSPVEFGIKPDADRRDLAAPPGHCPGASRPTG